MPNRSRERQISCGSFNARASRGAVGGGGGGEDGGTVAPLSTVLSTNELTQQWRTTT